MARHLGACALKIRSQKRGSLLSRQWEGQGPAELVQPQGPSHRASLAPTSRIVSVVSTFSLPGPGRGWRRRHRAEPPQGPLSLETGECQADSLRTVLGGPPSPSPRHSWCHPGDLGLSHVKSSLSIPLLENLPPYFLDDVPRRDLESLPSLSTTAD